jgi:hypothetical protein
MRATLTDVLPAPFAPTMATMATISPGITSNEISLTAAMPP